jgi:uncharacterized membrane protein
MEITLKNIGLLLSLIGGVGAVASVSVIFLLQGTCPFVIEFYHYVLIALMPIFVVILAVGLYLYFKKEEIKIKTIVKATKIEKILTPEEKRIIEFLKGKKDVTQADIRKELNIPRATLSVLLSKMEKRGLIKKKKIGKTNFVILRKGF